MKKIWIIILILSAFFIFGEDYNLAVLYFDTSQGTSGNISSEDKNALALALTEMMISDLSQLQVLTLVNRNNLNRIMDEQKLALSGLLDESSTVQAGELLGANFLMTGSLAFTGDLLTITARISQAESGQVLVSHSKSGAIEDIFLLQEELLEQMMIQWDIPLSRREWLFLAERDNVALEGLIRLGNALQASDSGNIEQALTYLKEAIQLNPDFQLASDLLEQVQQRFDRYLSNRDQDLPVEILDQIDAISQGVEGAGSLATRMYWAYLQPVIMGNSYYGTLQMMDEPYRHQYYHDYVIDQWNQPGITDHINSIEEMGIFLGRKIHIAQGILEYLLDKNLPLEGYGEYMHPVEGVMGYFLTLFAVLASEPDWVFPPMIDKHGNVVVEADQYYPVLLRYCDYFLNNFPYSAYSGMVTSMMQNILSKME